MSTGVYLQRWVRARIDEPAPLVLTVGVSLLWLALRSGIDITTIPATGETVRAVRVRSLVASGVPARLGLSPRQVLEKADTLVRTARLSPKRLRFLDEWRERVTRVIHANDYAEAREVAYAIAYATGFEEHIRFLTRYRIPLAGRRHGRVEGAGESLALRESLVRERSGRRSLQRLS